MAPAWTAAASGSSGEENIDAARRMATGRAALIVGSLCAFVGALGTLTLQDFLVQIWGQRLISCIAACLFALSNFVPKELEGVLPLSFGCGTISLVLGWGVAAALSSAYSYGNWLAISVPLFLLLVMLFHIAEFAFVVFCHPHDLQFGSFMLAPVPMGGYSIAMIAAVIEYWLEDQFLDFHALMLRGALCYMGRSLLLLGFAFGLLGWALRTAALFTARSNFTHLVAHRKRSSHVLVTRGVYQICRHPGYLGWLIWNISTQLVLLNPVCLIGYTLVSWSFFATRIPGEEELLVQFFGQQYLDYARRVRCGIPCISELDPGPP